MAYSRREEAFRYSFPEPLEGEFKLAKINGHEVESNVGSVEIIDLSLNGAKISTEYDLQIQEADVEITLQFMIMDHPFEIQGKVVHEESLYNKYTYGVHLNTDETTREEITEKLKELSWSLVENK